MSRADFASEADLAKVVITWLEAAGWAVFQEVEERGDVADIVATREGVVAVVECKMHLNLDLLWQTLRWRDRAHLAWAAVPPCRKNWDAFRAAAIACRATEVGLLEVRPAEDMTHRRTSRHEVAFMPQVRERVPPVHQPHDGAKLLGVLRPEHQTYAAAGSPTGHRWTPFRATERDLTAYVREHPGVLARDAVKAIHHHWQGKAPHGQAVQCIRSGFMPGLRAEVDGRQVRLYPVVATRADAEAGLTAAIARSAPDAEVARLAAELDAVGGS